MPGINDAPEQVEAILALAADAGATSVGGIALHLRGEVRGIFLDWLRSQRPDLVPRYERALRAGRLRAAGRAQPDRGRLARGRAASTRCAGRAPARSAAAPLARRSIRAARRARPARGAAARSF